MEGPTPVSALIHAATMVTAGVFMVARLSPLFELAPAALAAVTFVGATTAFFASSVALVQNDIKRIIAYSTCAQLGYMFVAMGVGAYSVGMFHLFTHASFKALLFLGAGSVIRAMHHEQDIQKMGGLRRVLPITYAVMVIATLSATGFPLTAGFFSKDAVIEAAYAGNSAAAQYAFWLTVIAAALTSFYSWRLIFVVFHGQSRADHHTLAHARESPLVMTVPLGFLAFGALVLGFGFKDIFTGAERAGEFFRDSVFSASNHKILAEMHQVPLWVAASATVMMLAGFLVAYWFYIRDPQAPTRLAARQDLLYRFLFNKWYFDEIYDFLFVRPAMWLGRALWKQGDGWLIDGFGPDGVSSRVLDVTRNVVRLQTGYLYHYAFVMLIGVAVLITWFLVWGGGS
jgi:NADH-quinone oxidoreductase subunit L